MADKTKIEWADATANYVNGCSIVSKGCTNCYAMRLAGTRMQHHPSRAGLITPSKAGPVWNGTVKRNERVLREVLGWKCPRRIFWNAHGDLFHDAVPDEWIDAAFAVMALTPQHQHLVLTKRPERMRAYMTTVTLSRLITASMNWPAPPQPAQWPLPNVWLGTSVEDQAAADERIPHLLATPAAVRFLSCEPLLGAVDLTRIHRGNEIMLDALTGIHGFSLMGLLDPEATALASIPILPRQLAGIDWVIVGGESGKGARPMHPDWARSLRDQCAAAGVPFFFKQWGNCLPGNMEGEDEDGRAAWMLDWDIFGDLDAGADFGHMRATLHFEAGYEYLRFKQKPPTRLLDGIEHNGMPA